MKPESNPRYTGLESMLTPDNSVLVLIDHQAFQFANVRNMALALTKIDPPVLTRRDPSG